jgi:hypothetical protein
MRPLPNSTCPLCGGPNGCVPASRGSLDSTCWCADVKFDPAALARVPERERNRSCLCGACATGGTAQGDPR